MDANEQVEEALRNVLDDEGLDAKEVLAALVRTLADRHVRAKLRQWQEQINGEYAALIGSRPADDQNAALVYRRIFAQLDRTLDTFDKGLDQIAPATEISDRPGSLPETDVAVPEAFRDTDLPESLQKVLAQAMHKSRAERLLEKRDLTQAPISLTGWRHRAGGAHVTLVETVRQDRAKHLTIFDQEFTERVGRRRQVRRFSLTFRTLSVPQMARRLEKAGFEVRALLGDYHGGSWDARAEVWVILATRPA
jgi:hypothetical protein